jgi:hypothetical protein
VVVDGDAGSPRAGGGARGGRLRAAIRERQPFESRPDRGECTRPHRQRRHAEPDEHRGQRGVRGGLAAHADRRAGRGGRLAEQPDQAQQRRLPRFVERGERARLAVGSSTAERKTTLGAVLGRRDDPAAGDDGAVRPLQNIEVAPGYSLIIEGRVPQHDEPAFGRGILRACTSSCHTTRQTSPWPDHWPPSSTSWAPTSGSMIGSSVRATLLPGQSIGRPKNTIQLIRTGQLSKTRAM